MENIKFNKPHLVHKQYELPSGCSIESVIIREMDGEDELEAARWMAMLPQQGDAGFRAITLQIGLSIVAVDGKQISHAEPYLEFNKWSSKTRTLVMRAWKELNEVAEEDLAVFHAAAKPLNLKVQEVEILDEGEAA